MIASRDASPLRGASAVAVEGIMFKHKVCVAVAGAGLVFGLSLSESQAQSFSLFSNWRYPQSYATGYSPMARSSASSAGSYGTNTIVISTSQRRLYYIAGNGQVITYPIGVGRAGFAWSGVTRVSAKKAWPSWSPPAQMRRRQPGLPGYMAGGINNPLGARALYLGSSLYRIHGSNERYTIGQAVSSGCFRMTNEDVVDLYNRVAIGTKVVVQ
jgi:lipoprotein-anchoring transpeptidase ErfK/SrfK